MRCMHATGRCQTDAASSFMSASLQDAALLAAAGSEELLWKLGAAAVPSHAAWPEERSTPTSLSRTSSKSEARRASSWRKAPSATASGQEEELKGWR